MDDEPSFESRRTLRGAHGTNGVELVKEQVPAVAVPEDATPAARSRASEALTAHTEVGESFNVRSADLASVPTVGRNLAVRLTLADHLGQPDLSAELDPCRVVRELLPA